MANSSASVSSGPRPPHPIQRQRTPSKASLAVLSTSSVSVAGLSQPADLEQKAQSRNTLSRHLSQGNLLANNSSSVRQRHRQRSASHATSETSVSTTTTAQRDTSEEPTESEVASSAARLPVRRASAAGPLPRSPSYNTVSRKSSLAIPQLSTIEGSISDLKQEEVRWFENQGFFTQNPKPVDVSNKFEGTDSDKKEEMVVKRPAETEAKPEEGQKQVKKQKSWLGDVRTPSTAVKSSSPAPGTGASKTSEAPVQDASQAADTDMRKPEGKDVEPTIEEKVVSGTDVPLPPQNSWMSYLTLGRSSRPPSIAPPPSPKPAEARPKHTTMGIPADLSGEAISASPNPAVSIDSEQNPANGPLDTSASAQSAISSAMTTPVATILSEGAQDSLKTEEKETVSADSADMARTPSWWFWTAPRGAGAAVASDTFTIPSTETVPVAPVEPLTALQLTAVSQRLQSDELTSGTPETVSSVATDATVGPPSTAQTATWSSWLGSYLSSQGAANTTTVTYGLGLAPSESGTSIAASSIASTIAPEADESFPDSPPETPKPFNVVVTPTATLHRNPLLDTVPLTSWSSFFTTRHIYPQKRLDTKAADDPGQPEEMDIDFGTSGPEAVKTSASAAVPASGPSSPTPKGTLKPSDFVFKKGHKPTSSSSSMVSQLSRTSQTVSTAKPSGSTAMTTSSSASSSTVGAPSSRKPTKPLTTDSASAKGKTTSQSAQKPPRPNLVLPSFEDTFYHPPRSLVPQQPAPDPLHSPLTLKRAAAKSFTWLFSSNPPSAASKQESKPQILPSPKGKEREVLDEKSERLPKALKVLGQPSHIERSGRICVIGVHGWFMQSYLKTVVGEPTGTSIKFASMMKAAVMAYYEQQGHPLNDEAVTAIPLEGDGIVQDRLSHLYNNLMKMQDWVDALNSADRVFVVAHSQGCIVSTMLLSRLISEGEVNGTKCAMLLMCGVSQGPFVSLYNSWTSAYLYLETASARELFEFQKPQSAVSKHYMEAMKHILNAGVKALFVASLNDQVVPLYSALFSSLSHPSMLRAIFIDSQAFESGADFMTNLVVFSTRLRNAGLSSHGLDFHLSEALAGALMGLGHSTIYDEAQVYRYAVRYLLETSGPLTPISAEHVPPDSLFEYEPFDPRAPANPYFLPWALRGILEDRQIRSLFADELDQLRKQFEDWHPKTKPLQQVKMALEPLRGLPKPKEDIAESAETGKGPVSKPSAKL